MYPTSALQHPDGTVTEVAAMREQSCRRWPWIWKPNKAGQKWPVDYDRSPEAEAFRWSQLECWQIDCIGGGEL